MGKKRIILTIFAGVALFGIAASGCNNNKTTAMRQPSRSARPAEVLSASASRLPARSVRPLPAPAAAPAYSAAPAYAPSLAMAYPAAQGRAVSAPVAYVPQHQQLALAGAPIPELEPARYARVVNRQPAQRPVAEVMMTARPGVGGDRQEVIRALAPIAPVAAANQGWVASPITAMNSPRGGY